MAYVYAACTVRVAIFSIGGNFCLISNSIELHAFTLAACSYIHVHVCALVQTKAFSQDAGKISNLKCVMSIRCDTSHVYVHVVVSYRTVVLTLW